MEELEIDEEEMIEKNEEMMGNPSLPPEARGFEPPEENYEDEDLNKDGIVTDEERREYYEREGWKSPHEGRPYYVHPWFDWTKKERWINNRAAIEYWIKHRGGSHGQFEKMKEQYPDDFKTKTY
jgi:hypothetical protein